MHPILFIAYHFPPQGGAGVQRALKFTKYLPFYGITTDILTSTIVRESRWVPNDPSMGEEVPPGTSVHRFEWPSYRRISKLINKRKLAKLADEGLSIALEKNLEAILVTMSPFSDALLAAEISRKSNIPWIADLRDPWALDEFQAHKTWLHRKAELHKMGRQLGTASAIIMNTPEAAKQLRDSNIISQYTPIYSITNGYDDTDFSQKIEPHKNDKFTIVHTGNFHTSHGFHQKTRSLEYKLLGRTKKGVNFLSRSPYYLIQALEQWAFSDERVANNVRIRFIGTLSEDDQSIIQQSKISDIVEAPGYQNHADSVKALQSADLLFLPMHSLPDNSRATIVPGKAYEYMASGVPILAAVPKGDTHDFLLKSGLGLTCAPDAPMQMTAILTSQFNSWNRGERSHYPNTKYIETFNRRALTKQLAGIIKGIVSQNSQ